MLLQNMGSDYHLSEKEGFSLFGIDWAPLNISFERRAQTFFVFLWFFSVGFGICFNVVLMYYILKTTAWPIVILYLWWMYYDWGAGDRGGRRFKWLRRLRVWKHFRDYFPIRLIKTADLPANRNYLFCAYPHGVLASGPVCNFATDANDFHKLYPGLDPHLLTLSLNFNLPISRETILGLGDYLEWPALDNKDISIYCRKFLQKSVPKRRNIGVTGAKIKKVLYYEKENIGTTRNIVIVCCKVKMKYPLSYYITQAPEPNCVYAVKHIRRRSIFIIIHKYCDFEDKPMTTMFLKRKMVGGIVSKIHPKTGQPIVKDKYLLEYELEHREMLKKEGKRGELTYWSQATEHPNLDSYCYEYMRACVPRRNRDGIIGSWDTDVIHYQKLNTNGDIKVMIVQCKQTSASERYYYLARALEINCVYGLIRYRPNPFAPFIIVFKCCDFENLNCQQTVSEDYEILNEKVILKIEVKEEKDDTLQALQLLPIN